MSFAEELLTHAYVRSRLDYFPMTGLFRWKAIPITRKQDKAWNTRFAGKLAGGICQRSGYVEIGIDNRGYYGHRLAWFWMLGEWPPEGVDHKDTGNKADNRWENLRLADQSQQLCNVGLTRNNTSGFRGVSWDSKRQKWQAQIVKNRRHYHLGFFDTPEEASAAYITKAIQLHGEFVHPSVVQSSAPALI